MNGPGYTLHPTDVVNLEGLRCSSSREYHGYILNYNGYGCVAYHLATQQPLTLEGLYLIFENPESASAYINSIASTHS